MKAYELLSNPTKWTKEYYARDEHGNRCDSESLEAHSWCLVGALSKCYQNYMEYCIVLDLVRNYIIDKGGPNEITRWNDNESVTYEQVIEVLKVVDV